MNTRRGVTILMHVGPVLALLAGLVGALPVCSARAAWAPQDGLTPLADLLTLVVRND